MAGAGGANGSSGYPGHGNGEGIADGQAPLLIPAIEVARMLGVAPRTLWRLVRTGRVPAPIRLKGSTRWPRAQIRSWVALGCPHPDSRGEGSGRIPDVRSGFEVDPG